MIKTALIVNVPLKSLVKNHKIAFKSEYQKGHALPYNRVINGRNLTKVGMAGLLAISTACSPPPPSRPIFLEQGLYTVEAKEKIDQYTPKILECREIDKGKPSVDSIKACHATLLEAHQAADVAIHNLKFQQAIIRSDIKDGGDPNVEVPDLIKNQEDGENMLGQAKAFHSLIISDANNYAKKLTANGIETPLLEDHEIDVKAVIVKGETTGGSRQSDDSNQFYNDYSDPMNPLTGPVSPIPNPMNPWSK